MNEKYDYYRDLAIKQWRLYPQTGNQSTIVILQYALLMNYSQDCLMLQSFAYFNHSLFEDKSDIDESIHYLLYARKLSDQETFIKTYKKVCGEYCVTGWEKKKEWANTPNEYTSRLFRKMFRKKLKKRRDAYLEACKKYELPDEIAAIFKEMTGGIDR